MKLTRINWSRRRLRVLAIAAAPIVVAGVIIGPTAGTALALEPPGALRASSSSTSPMSTGARRPPISSEPTLRWSEATCRPGLRTTPSTITTATWATARTTSGRARGATTNQKADWLRHPSAPARGHARRSLRLGRLELLAAGV